MISTSAWSSRAIELSPTTPHLVWSATTISRRPASTSVRSVSASSRFGEVKPGVLVHAVDAEQDEVEMDAPQGRHGERPDERVRGRPDATGQDDRLVRAARLVEDVGRPGRVRDDGQAPGSRPAAGRSRRSSSRPRSRSPTRLDVADRGVGDRLLLELLEGRLGGEARLELGAPGERGRSAVDLLDEPLVGEQLEVAPDRHVRHAQLADEVGHPDAAVLAHPVEDVGLALAR